MHSHRTWNNENNFNPKTNFDVIPTRKNIIKRNLNITSLYT